MDVELGIWDLLFDLNASAEGPFGYLFFVTAKGMGNPLVSGGPTSPGEVPFLGLSQGMRQKHPRHTEEGNDKHQGQLEGDGGDDREDCDQCHGEHQAPHLTDKAATIDHGLRRVSFVGGCRGNPFVHIGLHRFVGEGKDFDLGKSVEDYPFLYLFVQQAVAEMGERIFSDASQTLLRSMDGVWRHTSEGSIHGRCN